MGFNNQPYSAPMFLVQLWYQIPQVYLNMTFVITSAHVYEVTPWLPVFFAGWGFFFGIFCFFLVFFLVWGLREGRKQQPGRIGRKEGRREGRKEGSKEGGQEGRKEGGRARKGPYFCSHLRWKHWQQRYFLLNPEPKPYGPKALNHLTP